MIDPAAAASATSTANRVEKKLGEREGYSFWIGTFFIVSNMAGSGVLVLPRALADTGWGGIVFIILCCSASLYAGLCLARCWNILEERYVEFRNVRHRKPYPAIAEKAYGVHMRNFLSVVLEINFLGISIVYLLLPAEMIAKLIPSSWGIPFCYWILILAAVICPMMWFGTPKDFWIAAVLALVTIIGSIIMLLVAIAKHASSTSLKVTHKNPTFLSFFLSMGSIFFSFGGAASFPTFQNDMKNKDAFPRAVITGFTIVFLMYIPITIFGYHVYGDTVHMDITDSTPPSVYRTIVLFFMSFRSLFVFLMVINATSQEFEDILNVPDKFGWQRVLVRVTILLFVLFVALSIPRFGKILNLVGASAIVLCSTVLPCLFYYKLCSDVLPTWPDRSLPTYKKIILIIIGASGILGGAIATYSSFLDIVRLEEFHPPCYLNMKGNSTSPNASIDALSLEHYF
ncbi:uncharacterized protein [Parasteatoda tepidariorum]|uniref:uncharacterized protein n=1 Tax=Parasteatoda tepidariorum TaxID=114398 RepID=UPI0039BCB9C5